MRCPVCKSLKTRFFLETVNSHGSVTLSQEKFVILRCLDCGVIFPRAVVEKNFYQKYYPQNYYTSSRFTSPFLRQVYSLVARFFLKLQFGKYFKSGRVLDFGCGKGDFLATLPSSIEKYGVEINPQAVKYVKKNYPLIKIFSDLKGLELKKVEFDVITLRQVIEHLEQPKETLKRLVSSLKKGGYMIISTPNSNSLGFKWTGGRWFHLDAPRHLTIFNVYNLVSLSQGVGLRAVAIGTGGVEYPLDLFWSLFARVGITNAFANVCLAFFLLPLSAVIKGGSLLLPKNSEIISLVCKK